MKRFFSLSIVIVTLAMMTVSALAADTSRSYEFDLTANGKNEVYVEPGDIISVILTLKRTDSNDSAAMYAMQDEIRYDDEFIEIQEGGTLLFNGIQTSDILLQDGDRAFYMNFLSLKGGENWPATIPVGTFQAKVIADKGACVLANENCIVSVKDGTDSYDVSVKDLVIIIEGECIVTFDLMDGSNPETETAMAGSKLTEPDNPSRKGYTFTGWYKDSELTNPWDFEKDIVKGDMTLYAGWEASAESERPGFDAIFLLIVIAILIIFVIIFKKRKKNEE